jgi:hypothetical protein
MSEECLQFLTKFQRRPFRGDGKCAPKLCQLLKSYQNASAAAAIAARMYSVAIALMVK